MNNESGGNSISLKGLCVVLPAVSLVAAHFFPWRRLLRRNLHPLEAYAIGTVAIVGTSSFAIAMSEGDRGDHVGMLNLAAASAGLATIAAHVVDELVHSHGKIVELEAQLKALTHHADL